MSRTKRVKQPEPPSTEWLKVESLDLEAQGVAHNTEGKVVFIDGALPGELVQVQVTRRKNNWEQGDMAALRHESAQRVRPECPHFGTCGGCKLQHFHIGAQVATKQRALEDALWHLGKVQAGQLLRPIEGQPGATVIARGCRCVSSPRRAKCWSAFTSASRAMLPT